MQTTNQSISRDLIYVDLDKIDYKLAWDIQTKVFDLRRQKQIDDVFFMLEHPNTYTLGKVADKKNLIGSEKFLNENNISVYEIDRGGDITYHGPGQIVGYPIINLSDWKEDTHLYLRNLEEVLIRTCMDYKLTSERNEKYTGVWIDNRKIAAIGIKVSRWITMHGFAFNVSTNLNLFNGIIPCGISDKEVTSLNKELYSDLSIQEVKNNILNNFKLLFNYDKIITLDKKIFFQRYIEENVK